MIPPSALNYAATCGKGSISRNCSGWCQRGRGSDSHCETFLLQTLLFYIVLYELGTEKVLPSPDQFRRSDEELLSWGFASAVARGAGASEFVAGHPQHSESRADEHLDREKMYEKPREVLFDRCCLPEGLLMFVVTILLWCGFLEVACG